LKTEVEFNFQYWPKIVNVKLSELFEVLKPVNLLKKNNDINVNYTQLQFAF